MAIKYGSTRGRRGVIWNYYCYEVEETEELIVGRRKKLVIYIRMCTLFFRTVLDLACIALAWDYSPLHVIGGRKGSMIAYKL